MRARFDMAIDGGGQPHPLMFYNYGKATFMWLIEK